MLLRPARLQWDCAIAIAWLKSTARATASRATWLVSNSASNEASSSPVKFAGDIAKREPLAVGCGLFLKFTHGLSSNLVLSFISAVRIRPRAVPRGIFSSAAMTAKVFSS